MKIFWAWLLCGGLLFAAGCRGTGPEHFEELNDAERAGLVRDAKLLALQAKAVPDDLRGVFAEISPHERIIYDGDKHGRAAYRWEIYESAPEGRRITQKDVNPYWVMVYAEGDLRDPAWKLTHAEMDGVLPPGLKPLAEQAERNAGGRRNTAPPAPRNVNQVRYNR